MQVMVLLTTLLLMTFRTVELCEPDFGTNYPRCDLKQQHNIRNWQKCSKICSVTPSCHYWTWAHSDSTYKPLTCFLKKSKCRAYHDASFVSGDTSCTNTAIDLPKSACLPKYGLNYPGCDIKRVPNTKTWRDCSKLCFFTQGCRQWTWEHKGSRPYAHSCWLKNNICPSKRNSFVISGDALTYMRCKELHGNF